MGGILSGIGSTVGNTIGGLTGGLAKGLTPQNEFQTGNPDVDRQNFAQAITQSQQGVNNNALNQQKLQNALLAQSQGFGPNLGQMQLQNATGQNIKQNAGFIASQKGINPALAARLGAQSAAQMNQQAAGQSAMLSAQQQMANQQQLAGLYGQEGQQQLQNQGILQQSQAAQNAALTQGQLGTMSINSGVAAQNAGANQQTAGGILNSAGGALGLGKNFAHGGEVYNFDFGGEVPGQASVEGDSLTNDKVPAMLSPGEIVIPRSHTGSLEKMMEFVEALQKKESGKKVGYGDVVKAKRMAKGA